MGVDFVAFGGAALGLEFGRWPDPGGLTKGGESTGDDGIFCEPNPPLSNYVASCETVGEIAAGEPLGERQGRCIVFHA